MSKNGVLPKLAKSKYGSQKIVYIVSTRFGLHLHSGVVGNGGHGQVRTADLTIISRAL